MADISLRIKADFEQASAAFKKMESESESLQKKTAKLREEYEKVDKTIQTNISKNQLNSIALSAVKGSEAALRAESAALQRQMIQLIKMGMDPQSEALAKLRNRYTEVKTQLPQASASVSGFSSSLGSLGSMLVKGYIAKQIYDIGKSCISAAANMEQQRVAFTTMLGSAVKANDLLKQIQAFAEATPFQFNDLVDASKRMIAFGFSSDEVIPKLRKVGDVAAGLSQPIGDMIYLFGQVRTQGKAMTQDLNQFANRGVPIFEELAKVIYKTQEPTAAQVASIRKMAEESKITYSVVDQAFTNMTNSGGRFGGLMDAQSKTLGGQWSNFNDQLDKTKVLLGESLSKDAGDALGIMSELVKTYNTYLEVKAKQEAVEAKSAGFLEQFRANLEDIPQKIAAIQQYELWNYEDAAKYQDYLTGNIKLTGTEVEELKKKLDINRSISEIMKESTATAQQQAEFIGGEVGYMLQVLDAMKKQNELNTTKKKSNAGATAGGGQKKTEIQIYQDQLKKMQETEAWSFEERSKLASDYFAKSIEAEMAHGTTMQEWQAEQTSIIANNTKLSYDQRLQLMDEMRKAAQKKSADDIKRYAGYGVQIAGNASNMFADLQTVMENFGKKSKALAIAFKITSAAEAGINSFLAFTAVLADKTIQPTWLRIPMAGIILAAGLAKQAAILSTPIAETGLSSYTVPDIPSYRNDNYPVRAQSGETVTVTPKGEDSTSNTSVSISIQDKQIMSIFQKGVKSGRINVNNKNIRRGVFAH